MWFEMQIEHVGTTLPWERYHVRWRIAADADWRTFTLSTDERQSLLDIVDAAFNAVASYARSAAA